MNRVYALLLVGALCVSSLSSCAAIKRAKAKRCQCPTWGYEQQDNPLDNGTTLGGEANGGEAVQP